jgi:ketosteroid isomerase-like protein
MDATAAIRATVVPWTKAALDRNWDAMISMCTNDVVFAPPGEPGSVVSYRATHQLVAAES